MICPVCKDQNRTSTVISGGTEMTCVGFFPYHDAQGVLHVHNPNKHTTLYSCSNGHKFVHSYYADCPSCGATAGIERTTVIP